jgi:hypothetical protein
MLLAFGGTRTYHRLACAIEDAGWQIRDCLMWLHGEGFPKSLDISKAIDKVAGAERPVLGPHPCPASTKRVQTMGRPEHSGSGWQETPLLTAPATDAAKEWVGWGTALKPAWEPILLAMKPLDGTFAENALKHGVAGLNIDECRVPTHEDTSRTQNNGPVWSGQFNGKRRINGGAQGGRWPANVILDEEVASLLDAQSGQLKSGELLVGHKVRTHQHPGWDRPSHHGQVSTKDYGGDTGGASRFFYCAKTSKEEKGQGNNHPTVKPLSLMLWLVKLVCPTGGVCLDPFMGSGTTGVACQALGRGFVGIELDPAYFAIAQRRLAEAQGPLFAGTATNGSESHPPSAPSQGSLFPEGE